MRNASVSAAIPRSTGGERPGGPPKESIPGLAPGGVCSAPRASRSPALQGSTSEISKTAGVPPPRADPLALAAPRLLLAVQSSRPHWGSPQGSLCLGHSEETEQGGAQEDRAQGFPAGISWKVSTHELWDLRKTTLILQPAVT